MKLVMIGGANRRYAGIYRLFGDALDVAHWQCEPLLLDPLPTMQALGYGPDDLSAAIRNTVRATLEHGGQGPARLDPAPAR